MGNKYTTIKIKVSAQTAYHLDQASRQGGCSMGRIVDKLVRAWREGQEPYAMRTYNTKGDRTYDKK